MPTAKGCYTESVTRRCLCSSSFAPRHLNPLLTAALAITKVLQQVS